MKTIIKQRAWTEAELRAAGFQHYARRKQVVMARALPEAESPLRIVLSTQETVVVQAPYVICYDPGESVRASLSEYPQWPVRPDMFENSYSAWDEIDWQPAPPQKHLLNFGCKPYFKHQGVWAKRLTKPAYVQSIESMAPVLVPAGDWVLVGSLDGPYYMTDELLRARYLVP
jgi:hypothetical protein